MSVRASIRAYFGIVPRTFWDGVRLYAAYAVSAVLRLLAPSQFRFAGRWVPGRAMLGVSIDGLRFDVRPRTNDLDLISAKHEPATTAWFTPRPGDVFIDVGAHIGRYALRAAAQGARVVAVEPDPSNFELLKKNVALNGFNNAILVPQALSAESGLLSLRLAPRENTGTSMIQTEAPGTSSNESERVVPVTGGTLDELVQSLGVTRIDWLKVDVEGHEVAVLRGARTALNITKYMVLEVTEATRDSCRAMVAAGGFELLEVEPGDPASNWLLRRAEDKSNASAATTSYGRGESGPSPVRQPAVVRSVSVGICAYNEASRIQRLLDSLPAQRLPPDFCLLEIVVVASGCTDGTVDIVKQRAQTDSKTTLIEEPQRNGKASALNLILNRFRGDFLVLVNADARLSPGSISALLDSFDRSQETNIACGFPIPEPSPSPVVSLVEEGWWRLHNRTLEALATLGRGNHCCDELMAIRRGFANSIPVDVICDGSYFGAYAATRGTTVQLCKDAKVFVDTPSSLSGVLQQRRRNLRGHWQVADLLRQTPFTLEGLLRTNPTLAGKILLREFVDRPLATSAFLLIAAPFELLAHMLAHFDGAIHPDYQPMWPMVE